LVEGGGGVRGRWRREDRAGGRRRGGGGASGAVVGTRAVALPGGGWLVVDQRGGPVGMGAPLPGEGERPGEIISAPIEADHANRMEALLRAARALRFRLPREAVTHIHFDGAPLQDANTFANVIHLFGEWLPTLKALFKTTPACRRLGSWPEALYDIVGHDDFRRLQWPEAAQRLKAVPLSKYRDVNVKNVVMSVHGKTTLEVRVLPGLLHSDTILFAACVIEKMLFRAMTSSSLPRRSARKADPNDVTRLLSQLEIQWQEGQAADPIPAGS